MNLTTKNRLESIVKSTLALYLFSYLVDANIVDLVSSEQVGIVLLIKTAVFACLVGRWVPALLPSAALLFAFIAGTYEAWVERVLHKGWYDGLNVQVLGALLLVLSVMLFAEFGKDRFGKRFPKLFAA